MDPPNMHVSNYESEHSSVVCRVLKARRPVMVVEYYGDHFKHIKL